MCKLALKNMVPAGYMLKTVMLRPDWLEAGSVEDIYCASGCLSENFADYIKFWKHNGFWLFDSPWTIIDLAKAETIDVTAMTMFYYEIHEEEYDDQVCEWRTITPDCSFSTHVLVPREKQLADYDVATFSAHNSTECSHLSCNSLAKEIKTNKHCLFESFREAKDALEAGLFCNSEPGPFRILAVYTVESRQ